MKHLTFLKAVLKTQCKLILAFKLSLFLKIIAIVIRQGLFIVTWGFFFNRYISIEGWGFSQALAMFGIISFGIGFVELFFYGLRELPFLIETNQLDNYITQPKNILLNVAISKGDITAISEIIYGLLLLFVSGYLFTELKLVILVLPLSIFFIFSLYLYLSSIGFFIKNSQGFVRELYQNANVIISQPSSAYRGFFKIFTLTILPTAYLNFFPVEFLINHHIKDIFLAYLGSLLFLALACLFFYKGLKRYESSSIISYKY
ncbi:MAG: ABC-2 family transporter protein [Parachlamydiales bacterium]|nr:ABC-2 family transporter protein [Parachlamydiales bacterium]